jgi:group I intron endonuclease
MYKKICGIYCIENIVTNKKYIGAAKNIKSRFSSHKYRLKNGRDNYLMLEDFAKHGMESFTFYIIEECSIEDLEQCETYYIDLYQTKRPMGYNIERGGSHFLGQKHSNEAKEKLSIEGKKRPGKKLTEKEKINNALMLQGVPKTKPSTSKFVGVSLDKSGKWIAAIRYSGQKYNLGRFQTEVEAAMAYNEIALEFYGWKARLNIISEEEINHIWND